MNAEGERTSRMLAEADTWIWEHLVRPVIEAYAKKIDEELQKDDRNRDERREGGDK